MLFYSLAKIGKSNADTGQQHFLCSFTLFIGLALNFKHDLEKAPQMPQKLNPAKHTGKQSEKK